MKLLKKYHFSLFLMIFFFSCSEEEYINSELDNLEFQPYLNSFLKEANNRGYDFSNHKINFYFADIKVFNVAGLCSQNHEIVIDRGKWYKRDEIDREKLIFHELGHCILNREHKNEKSNSGECFSYMRGAENNFTCSTNIYSSLWRKYYIDELFDKNTSFPDWYSDNQEYNINYKNKNDFVSIANLNTNSYETTLDFNNTNKFVIEFTFKDWRASFNDSNFSSINLYFGGFVFGCAPFSKNRRIYIDKESIGVFFENNEYEFNKDIKLTVRKSSNLIQFFIEKKFIHAMEVKPFINKEIRVASYKPTDINIQIFEYN